MRICYIAHPIGGNVQENLADLRRIIRKINLSFDDVVPFVPYYADVVSLNDDVPAERARGIKNDHAVLETGIVREIWLTGPHISNGMKAENELAERLGIVVRDFIGVF